MISSGAISLKCSKIVSSDVSQTIMQFDFSYSMRSARNFICLTLSSPDTYSTRLLPILSTVCRTRVDFPMPGSPPKSTNEPGTRPPPSTRFSSASFMSIRGSSSVDTSSIATGRDVAFSLNDAICAALSVRILFSTKLFHAPQAGHLPAHFGES